MPKLPNIAEIENQGSLGDNTDNPD